MDSVIQISPAAAVTLIVGFLGVVFGFGRILLSQFERRMTERFTAQDKLRKAEMEATDTRMKGIERGLETESRRITEMSNNLHALSVTMPLEYVRREDWIRFSATIDKKLDALAELMLRREDVTRERHRS